jgi:hypothetical protein
MLRCLKCDRVFPDKIQGGIEPGGAMLCLSCAHVMSWADDLTLREMTPDEYIEAGSNFELMRARAKILPWRGEQHRGSSWALTLCLILIMVMMTLERLHVILPIHHK